MTTTPDPQKPAAQPSSDPSAGDKQLQSVEQPKPLRKPIVIFGNVVARRADVKVG